MLSPTTWGRRFPKFRMADCLPSRSASASPPVYVISHIPNIAKCLEENGITGVQVDLSDVSENDPVFNVQKLNTFKDAEIAICDGNLLAKVYKSLPNLKWAHCTWAGIDSLIREIEEEPSFAVTRHSGHHFCAMMAEYVLCHIVNCERKNKICWENQSSKIWSKDEKLTNYRTLRELTVSVLGVGNMGSEIAKILRSRGATVLGFARNFRSVGPMGDFKKISINLEDILSCCDYFCNTLPSTPLTRGILTIDVLRHCEKKPVFVNVGRGDVITEDMLVEAIRIGYLSGAVLDVFQSEPLPRSSQLWNMREVTITPHIAAVSKPLHIVEQFAELYGDYEVGNPLKNKVNWAAGY